MKCPKNKHLIGSIIALVLILIVSLLFMDRMIENSRMETDLDEYMPYDHPAFVFSDQAEEIFNINDGILIAVENKEGIYNPSTLKKIKDLTRQLQKMDEINKDDVTSLYTAENIVGTEGSLDVKDFYNKIPQTEEELKQLQSAVRSNEMVFKRIVSENEQIALIVAEIDDDVFTIEFYHAILDLTKSYEGPEKLHVAGVPIVEGTLAYLAPKDMMIMVPIVIAVIILVLYFVMRSVRNTIFTLLVVLFSTIWAFGLMAVIGIPIYSVSTMIPVMLIAIGVADGIHLYSHLDLYLFEHPDAKKLDAVKDMIKGMWKPIVMTSVTTAVGFISLLTSEVYPIKYFGLFTAFGVLMAMVFSLVLIPASIIVFGLPRRKVHQEKSKEESGKFSYKFAEGAVKFKALVISVTVIIIVISVIGINEVWINSSFLDKFEKDSDIVLTDAFINQHFGGTNTLNVILESDDQDKFKEPEVQRLIDKMQADVESIDVVGNSFSLADYIKRMNKVMNADNEAYNTIPESQNLIAQYLLLYEMSGDPDNLWKVVDYDYKLANVNVQLKSDNSKEVNRAIEILDKYKADFEKYNVNINYAGSGYKALVFTDLILEGQITSLLLSLLLIIILLSVMFRKISIGFIGSIPIVITAVISFGLMGIFNIALSTTTALISSIAVGIGIDYAVHFIERYKIYALESGNKELTIKETMHHSGRAISFNAVVVIAGFLVLLFSVFPPNRSLGALVSLNMFTSFIGTVTIMFLVLYKSNMYFKKKRNSNENK
ncbi:MAG: MMPL family transporter [Melioribacteraceae bacterium]|nr:MMPL family transporter [Melioribacteraceae bacterium]MCF8354121.1 MMPL family transporter [Melioribacteraceae bacterium]MCF8393348.1 MMPL family transporter [Melioribacteraceae bacterium]MCF8418913.1 MMPL family transporter [Melioribacteraceae bacterium]